MTNAEREYEIARAFSPAAPIDQAALFAGRTQQLRDVLDAVMQRGQHVVIFGERGVGKTSLANVLASFLTEDRDSSILAPKVNCDGSDDYASVWRKVLGSVELTLTVPRMGFGDQQDEHQMALGKLLPKRSVKPDDIQRLLEQIGARAVLVIIIDEFDRLRRGKSRALFADTIKTLSDYSVPATLVLVGVADTVSDLIREHASIERALVQVRMPRMSREELHEIIHKGLGKVGFQIEEDALLAISTLSQGLPHYTHLLGLHSARAANGAGQSVITIKHVGIAINEALDKAQQSIVTAYHRATMSPRRENLYAQVLLACAMGKCDDLGYFAAADVREPMTHIMGRSYEIPAFSRHLNDFCETTRGPVLSKIGTRRRFRFRFITPLMQPYVIMRGLNMKLIDLRSLR